MKSLKFLIITLFAAGMLAACKSSHPANHNNDSLNKNPYNNPPAIQKPDSVLGDTTKPVKKDSTKK